MSSECARIRNL